MSRKQTEIPTETVAAEEIYKTARAAADRDLAEMREKMNLSNELGLIAGRIQAYKSIELLSEYLGYKQLAKIIDNKEFKKIPGITSIDDYLEQLGIGRSTAYNNLKIARTLTVEEVKLLDKVGFTRRDLLGYASLPDEARMEIRDGKVINLEKADKEEIRKVIEDIILENKKVKEDTDAEIRVRDREIASKRELIKKQEKELALFDGKGHALERLEAFVALLDTVNLDCSHAKWEARRAIVKTKRRPAGGRTRTVQGNSPL